VQYIRVKIPLTVFRKMHAFFGFFSKSAFGFYIGVYKGRGPLYMIWRQSFIYFETTGKIEVIEK